MHQVLQLIYKARMKTTVNNVRKFRISDERQTITCRYSQVIRFLLQIFIAFKTSFNVFADYKQIRTIRENHFGLIFITFHSFTRINRG